MRMNNVHSGKEVKGTRDFRVSLNCVLLLSKYIHIRIVQMFWMLRSFTIDYTS